MTKWKYAYPVIQESVSADIMAWPAVPDYETVFGKLKEMGYEGIELQARDFRAVDTGRLRHALEMHGLKLAAVGTSPMQKLDGLFLLHEDPAVRASAEQQAFLQLALCPERANWILTGSSRHWRRSLIPGSFPRRSNRHRTRRPPQGSAPSS